MKGILFISLLFFSSISYSQNNPETFPGWMEDAKFIYHPPSKAMLLIGGTPIIQDSVQSDVWAWGEKGWSKIRASGPGARVFFMGDLNTKTNAINMFAGSGLGRFNSNMKDLWRFDGKKWSRIMNNDIGSHNHFKMVYADHLNAFVLYGGNVNNQFDTTTWLMQDGKFTKLSIRGPGVKYQSGMVYDKYRRKIVLYGGGNIPDELWEFDGTKWEHIVTEINPGKKLYHHMVYDENLKAVILHGGQINHQPLDPENLKTPFTWLWNGKEWRKIAEEKLFAIAIGYNPIRKSVLAYGFSDGDENNPRNIQLWELKDYKWSLLTDYGTWNTIDYLEKYLASKPDNNSKALYIYAYRLKSSNRLPEAEVSFKKIVSEKMPEQASALRGLIDVLKTQKKLTEAEDFISKLEPISEKNRIATQYYNLACAFALAGQAEGAFRCLDKAINFGYQTKKDYENDTDLKSLKPDSRWNELLGRLK
jgi:hypothetical protein